jgi:hypothetical protein
MLIMIYLLDENRTAVDHNVEVLLQVTKESDLKIHVYKNEILTFMSGIQNM